MRITIISLLTFLFFINSFSQNKSFTDTYGKFVIKQRKFSSKSFADAMDDSIENNLMPRQWTSVVADEIDTLLPPPPSPPSVASYDFKRFKHFIIKPDYYIQYNTSYNDFDSDSFGSEPRIITKINRSDLSVEKFSTFNFTKSKGQLYRMNICDYKILEEFKDDTNNISGYNCFKIILKNNKNQDYKIELYVTPEIKLNYHPIINCKEIITKYYPLYIKKFHINYPNDNFEEYSFIKI